MSETAQSFKHALDESPLSPFRALDITDEKGHFCGKLLAEMGADVIKIEPPGGDPVRKMGPFYHDIPHPEHSLPWWAFNTGKRSVTLDIETPEGRDLFRRLAGTAHFVIESFSPGHLDKLGLGYSTLSKLNPGLILISITPFGQTGPHNDLKVSDIVLMAMGSQMYGAGDADRPPVRVSVPQAYALGGLHAALGGMLALHYRQRTGLGQHVDVSIQEGVIRTLSTELCFWEFKQELCPRSGPFRARGVLMQREVWPCKDGEITLKLMGAAHRKTMEPLSRWMKSEGWKGGFASLDWPSANTLELFSPRVQSWQDEVARFFLTHTKAELNEKALKTNISLSPCQTPADILDDEQLHSRNFWVNIEHPDLSATITYPGPACQMGLTPWRIRRRAPLAGEHTREVLNELASSSPKGPEPRTRAEPSTGSRKALEGIKVADFSWLLAGPLCTKSLADFGATVVKVESTKRVDASRTGLPYKDGIQGHNRGGTFRHLNTSKYSLSLNLSLPRALDVAKRLVAWSDVVVENFGPGTMEKMGLSYEQLKKVKPDIIMLSSSNQGQTGPHKDHRGFGWNLGGLAGFNHFTGWPDRVGVGPNPAWTDYFAPWYGAVAILSALEYRRRTGKGQYIDLSQYEAGLSLLSVALLDYTANGREQTRQGNRAIDAAPHAAYPCRGEDPSASSGQDRWCVIAVHTQDDWKSFAGAMGNPDWTKDARFATLAARKAHEDELDTLVAAWTLSFTPEEVMARLQGAGVAAGIVQNARDLLDKDPQIKHRGYFQQLNHPEMGMVYHAGWPAQLSYTPHALTRCPLLGEHTDAVCRDMLKLSEEEIKDLKAAGILD